MISIINTALAQVKAAAVDTVTTTALQNSSSVKSVDLSFWSLFLQADMIVKLVMIILILSSIYSWSIIFDKWLALKSVHKKTRTFEKAFWSGQSLELLYSQIKSQEDHPMAMVFSSAMQEWQNRGTIEPGGNADLRVGINQRIYQSMQVAINKSIGQLDKNLNFLATLGSSAPFIGLFGTVWGIMVSFQSIAVSKNTTLAVVAPGIAEALLATAFGLVAAIPAVIFYNKFASEINKFSVNIEDFSSELSSIMSRELDTIR